MFLLLFSPWFFIILLGVYWYFLKIDNSVVSKWYQTLDDKSMSVCIHRVKFDIDLSFSEKKRFYWIKFINAYTNRERKIEREGERKTEREKESGRVRVHQRNFKVNETNSGGRVFLVKYIHICIIFLMYEILFWQLKLVSIICIFCDQSKTFKQL